MNTMKPLLDKNEIVTYGENLIIPLEVDGGKKYSFTIVDFVGTHSPSTHTPKEQFATKQEAIEAAKINIDETAKFVEGLSA